MNTVRPTLLALPKRVLCGLLAAVFMLFMPAPYVFADGVDGSTPTTNTCTPVATPPSGLQQPTGADSGTYTYNSCTGLWENDHYTWNPLTHETIPKDPIVYWCNSTTWSWQYNKWVFSPSRGKYYQTIVVVGALPSGAVIAADSLLICAPPVITNTGPDSTNVITDAANSSADLNNTTNATLNNQIGSTALTGNTLVGGNTLGGSATSGNALVMATIINALQSSTSLSGAPVATFTANINGDVQGDLIIDPGQLQPAVSGAGLAGTDVTMNNATNGQINNDIKLDAASGNATVSENTAAGNATSGNATAIANVVNMLNSMVSAGQSFVGVININGNMNGNILMPQSFLDDLIASNAPSTTLALNPTQASSLGITNTNNLSTTNNVTSSATSGVADAANNTSAGNATSGDANTSVRIFNLTGARVVGANALLVFVNVSGTWVGVIMNAPAGATAAALGGGVLGSGIDGNITNTNNDAITNNINVSAQTGDATVANNTSAGNATSGDANTMVNLLNMNNSAFNLTGWFGILFINIFGNWYGNFSVYTPPAPDKNPNTVTPQNTPPAKPFQFVSHHDTGPVAADSTNTPSVSNLSAQLANATAKTLGAAARKQQSQSSSANGMQFVSVMIVAGGLSLFAVERIINARQIRRTQA